MTISFQKRVASEANLYKSNLATNIKHVAHLDIDKQDT